MITYRQAIEALQGAVCPRCLHQELSARLHLDEGRECLCTAHCEHCGETFLVEYTRFETLEEVQKRVEAALARLACPVCEGQRYRLDLRCEARTEDCYFEATCRSCGTGFRVVDHRTHLHLKPQEAADGV